MYILVDVHIKFGGSFFSVLKIEYIIYAINMVQLSKHDVNFLSFLRIQIFNLTTFITFEHYYLSISSALSFCLSSILYLFAILHLLGSSQTILHWKGLHSSYQGLKKLPVLKYKASCYLKWNNSSLHCAHGANTLCAVLC